MFHYYMPSVHHTTGEIELATPSHSWEAIGLIKQRCFNFRILNTINHFRLAWGGIPIINSCYWPSPHPATSGDFGQTSWVMVDPKQVLTSRASPRLETFDAGMINHDQDDF